MASKETSGTGMAVGYSAGAIPSCVPPELHEAYEAQSSENRVGHIALEIFSRNPTLHPSAAFELAEQFNALRQKRLEPFEARISAIHRGMVKPQVES